jgi:poly-beta-hydroxyalkanoate depolymerase
MLFNYQNWFLMGMYSKHPNTKPSGIRMVIPGTQFLSGFWIASLDRFGMNKIFFMTLINKTV